MGSSELFSNGNEETKKFNFAVLIKSLVVSTVEVLLGNVRIRIFFEVSFSQISVLDAFLTFNWSHHLKLRFCSTAFQSINP